MAEPPTRDSRGVFVHAVGRAAYGLVLAESRPACGEGERPLPALEVDADGTLLAKAPSSGATSRVEAETAELAKGTEPVVRVATGPAGRR